MRKIFSAIKGFTLLELLIVAPIQKMLRIFVRGKSAFLAFTLLELLIVIGILAILATGVVVILNPAELLKQSRDAKRMAELSNLDKALELYSFNGGTNWGSTTTVYISLPDSDPNCSNWVSSLPTLPDDWNYECSTSDDLRKVDGNGWIPVDFTNTAITPPLNVLPVDPINTPDSYYFYTVGSWKLTVNLESQKYKDKKSNSQNISYSLCPRTVKDADNNEYLTVLIHGQCWMAENLNRGTRIDGAINMTSGAIEKYCYNDLDSNCTIDGGLYQWDEAMNYSTIEGSQGICPNDWHIPTDSEWYTLEQYLAYSTNTCSATRLSIDCVPAGTKLQSGGSSNFNALLSGHRISSTPYFEWINNFEYPLSSTQNGSNIFSRYLRSGFNTIGRDSSLKTYGYSIRCLKD